MGFPAETDADRRRGRRSVRQRAAGRAGALLASGALALGAVPGNPAPAVAGPVATAATGVAASAGAAPTEVTSRRVTFTLDNTNETSLPCLADGEQYQVRGRLVGPRSTVLSSTIPRVNVLVHGISTAGWLWNLRRHPAYDYAGGLAARGETSLVLDRLGHGGSPLDDGTATCLGAQAQMLSQLVQHLYAGAYDAAGGHAPAATHVVLHGHSAGAAIAQITASINPDVEGLVLMSWSDLAPSSTALTEAAQQTSVCARGGETFGGREHYALFGGTAAAYRDLLFQSAPARVRRAASERRAPTPCGDALSLSGLLTNGVVSSRQVDVPVLLLFGAEDALTGPRAARLQAASYGSGAQVTSRVFAGAGSALPLERQAPEVRRTVLRWMRTTPDLAR